MNLQDPPKNYSNICFYCPSQHQNCHTLKDNVQSFASATYSPILSLAAYILFHQPTLTPPSYDDTAKDIKTVDQVYANQMLCINIYYEPWCDYLVKLVENEYLLYHNNTTYFFAAIQPNYCARLNGMSIFKTTTITKLPQNHIPQQLAPQVFKVPQMQQQKPFNIGLINFSLSQLQTDPYIPKINLRGIFQGRLYRNGDRWQNYFVLREQYPTQDQLMNMDAVILTGSNLSVNSNHPSVIKTLFLLQKGMITNRRLRVVGVCFGHQALAWMSGGSVVQNNLYAGVQKVNFDWKYLCKLMDLCNVPKELVVTQYHGDEIGNMPNNFHSFAHSKQCAHEAIISEDLRTLCFQFHPEYSIQYMNGFQLRKIHYQKQEYIQQSKPTINQDNHKSSHLILTIIRSFIDQNHTI